MLFSKFAVGFFLFFTLVAALPVSEWKRATDLEARFWNGKVDPNLKRCKKLADCHCPKGPGNKIQSTSCINGVCKCNDPVMNFVAAETMKAFAAVGNAPITKAIGHLMAGIADAKQVLSTILGAVLGPEAKAALKIALQAVPDTGPSHIDQATKKFLLKGF